MAKNANFVSHKKSKQIVNGKPKLPLATDLVEGEIAINFGKDVETLSIKNESGDVVTFSSDNYYTEQKLGSGFTGENSGVTVTDAILWVSGTGENSVVLKGSSGTASGDYSVAEGNSTSAMSPYSHTEGYKTFVNGPGSEHAEGYSTSAVAYSHAEGYSTSAVAYSHAEGYNTSAAGYSHAEGNNTTASGNYSHAEGQATSAMTNYSHAEGYYTQANGSSSHAEGYNTKANGESSHAEGYYTSAMTIYSHAEGYYTQANGGYGSHTEGNNTVASGSSSHAEGYSTQASGNSSHAEGYSTQALGDYSHAEGASTTASGDSSHAEGNSTKANGYSSHAEGNSTKANGYSSHAEGNSTTANGYSSHAEGNSTTASGDSSHAEGVSTKANGYSSHAEGVSTKASGHYSHAEGINTVANNQAEHASGQYNVSSSASTTFGDSGNTLFSVGNGTTDNVRHNAFEIRQNGDIYIVNKDGDDVRLQDEIGNIDVDQVLDDTTSASTNPVSSKAVYKAVTDNELVWTNAFVALSGTVSAHTENTEIHVTAADKEKLHTHTNKTALDSITGNVGTMAYQNANSYSSATEVQTALSGKANTASTLSGYGIADAYTKSETSGKTEIENALNAKSNTTDLANFFDDAKYEDSGNTKVINFYHGNTIKATIDASDFIVDGMVDDVKIENGYLVIDFNTASGKQDISIPLTDIFDPSNYYNKTAIDNLVGSGFTSSSITDVIIENEEIVSNALTDLDERKLDATAYTPTDLSNYYTKSETSGKTEISTALGGKVNTATFTGHTADTSLHFSGNEKRNLDALETNIESISGITSNDIANWNAAAGVDMSKYYQKTETSGSTELSTAFSNKADSSALTTHTSDTTIHITSAERTAWNAKADISDIPSVNGYADSVQYNSTTKKVEFYHGTTAGTKVFEYDASPFLIDGMVQNVEIKDVQSGDPAVTVTCLVVSFNTDAGKQDINIPISQIFDASNYYTTAQTSGATELQTALNSKVDTTAFTNHTSSSVHMTTTEKTNLDSLATNIAAISGITATKVSNWDDANTKKHTHSNKTALDSITGNVGTMAYEDKTSYSSATEVNTALSNKADKTAVDDLNGQSETIAAALNDLNTRLSENSSTVTNKADISDVEELEETLTAAVTDINTRMAENTALAELAEQVRLLTERVKALENAAQTT